MSIMPEGEGLRKAIKWISDMRRDEEGGNLATMIEKAAKRFDLSPKDEEFLIRFFTSEKKD